MCPRGLGQGQGRPRGLHLSKIMLPFNVSYQLQLQFIAVFLFCIFTCLQFYYLISDLTSIFIK